MRQNVRTIAVAAVFFMVSTSGALAIPPLEAFGKREMASDVVMSPGGKYFAALQWLDGQAVLAVYSPFSKDPADRVRMLALDASKKIEEKVESIVWLNDETIGMVFRFEGLRGNVPTQETRMIAARYDLKKIRQIPKPSKKASGVGQIQHRIVDYLDHDPEHILMALDKEGYGQEWNVYLVTLRNGGFAETNKGGPDVAWYLADQNGEARLRGSYPDKRFQRHYRKPGSLSWNLLEEGLRTEGTDWTPEVFSSDPDVLLVSQNSDSGFDKVRTYRLSTKELGDTVFNHPKSDILSVQTDRYTNEVIGYSYAIDSYAVHFVDPELNGLQQGINQALPGKHNAITSWDRNRSMFVIFSSGPRDPGTYYIYLKSSGNLAKVLDRNSIAIPPANLGIMKRIAYKARDGEVIPAFLTTPPQGAGPHPFVVLPHGGPTARDYLSYDFIVQFLASRGYAVLQPQFRGSSGFGAKFQTAGYAQWGMLMQDDITDGAKAMIEQGIADPERTCIVGASYGGYAALMGAALTPDLYQCSVSLAGVTDINYMLRQGRRYKFASDNPPNVGHRRDDKDQLRDTSPINNIDAIEMPILLIHGDKDLSVNVSHSRRMAKALKKAGKPHKLVILEDGNHHLQLERHRIRFLKELEGFLDEHIGR